MTKTINRAVTEGSESSDCYPPLHVSREGRKVYVETTEGETDFGVWGDEAIELGLALVELGTEAKLS